MIQLLYGDDLVGVEEALAELTANSGPEDLRDVNHLSLRADDLTPDSVMAAAFTVPFMTDRRVVVVKDLLARFERARPRRGAGRSGGTTRDPLGEWAGLVDQLELHASHDRLGLRRWWAVWKQPVAAATVAYVRGSRIQDAL